MSASAFTNASVTCHPYIRNDLPWRQSGCRIGLPVYARFHASWKNAGMTVDVEYDNDRCYPDISYILVPGRLTQQE